MNVVKIIKRAIEPYPRVRALVKRAYQMSGYIISDRNFKSEGGLERVTPKDEYEYFYGYYDKSPWDTSGRYILATRVKCAYLEAESSDECSICLIDTKDKNRIIELCKSRAWNVQQGCMAQWLGPDFSKRIIFNDFRDGAFCSVVFDVEKKTEERTFSLPVYDVSRNGRFALSLDFTRLHFLRRGYGYSNLAIKEKLVKCPNRCCIWWMDLITGETKEILKYTDFAMFQPKETMESAYHKVNHIMIAPDGNRFMVIHRWIQKGRKYSRLVTADIDGNDLYNLSDDVFVSHCFWRNNRQIIAFLRKRGSGDHYYLMKDKTDKYKLLWPGLKKDGHCSFSHDGKMVVTDTYPNSKRISTLYICNPENGQTKSIAKVFIPFRYDNDVRCDLHPRWSRDDKEICIDSAHEGKREMYIVKAI